MDDFLVVDQPSAYNAIIGRPLMKKTNMVSAVYCLTIKFPIPTGVGYIKADQAMARQCHIQAIHLGKQVVCKPDSGTITSTPPISIPSPDWVASSLGSIRPVASDTQGSALS